MKKLIKLLFYCAISIITAQTDNSESGSLFPTSEAVLDSLIQNYERIEDYYVKIEISIKTPILRMPRKRVEFWYKAPNLTKAKTKGFAAIPKSGLISSPVELFDNLKDLSVVGAEYYDDRQVWILRGELHPDSLMFRNMGDIDNQLKLSMRLLVDRERWILIKSETWVDTMKVVEISSEYKLIKDNIYLPEDTIIQFEYKGGLPSGMEDAFNTDNHMVNMKKDVILDSGAADSIAKQEFSGIITIKFSDYKVNQGIEKSFFIEDSSE